MPLSDDKIRAGLAKATKALAADDPTQAGKALASVMDESIFTKAIGLEIAKGLAAYAEYLVDAGRHTERDAHWAAYHALMIRSRQLAPDDEALAQSLIQVAILTPGDTWADHALAADLVRKSLVIYQKRRGADDPMTTAILGLLDEIRARFKVAKLPRGAQRVFRIDTAGAAGNEDLVCTDDQPKALEKLELHLYKPTPLGPEHRAGFKLRCEKGATRLQSLVGTSDPKLLLVDARFRAILEKAGANFEIVPIELLSSSRKSLQGDYALVHALAMFGCARKDCDPFWAEQIVLDAKKTKGAPALFLLPNQDPERRLPTYASYLVNEDLASRIYEAQLSNVYLMELRQT
jgi:hypothetical protein